jgi:hypothetical protein
MLKVRFHHPDKKPNNEPPAFLGAGGIVFLFCHYFSRAGLPFAHTCPADHLILRRAVAVDPCDGVADPLGLVPQASIDRVALIALVCQSGFQGSDLCIQGGRGAVCCFCSWDTLCFFRLRKWDLKIENTSLAQFAFHPNFSAVPLRNGFDNGKPQPGAAFGQRFAVRTAIEFFE